MTDSKTEDKWYKEGLRFKCTECGKCCTGSPGYVWITEEEITGMAAALNISVDLFKRRYTRTKNNRLALIEKKMGPNQYDCIFLQDKKCQLYTNRPKQCRTFPWWKNNLTSEESWKQTAMECEGINDHSPLISFDEIERLVQLNEQEQG